MDRTNSTEQRNVPKPANDSPKERETLTSFPDSLSRGGGWGIKLPSAWTPSPSLWASSVNDLECFGRKQKSKIDCNFQFLDFRRKRKK